MLWATWTAAPLTGKPVCLDFSNQVSATPSSLLHPDLLAGFSQITFARWSKAYGILSFHFSKTYSLEKLACSEEQSSLKFILNRQHNLKKSSLLVLFPHLICEFYLAVKGEKKTQMCICDKFHNLTDRMIHLRSIRSPNYPT